MRFSNYCITALQTCLKPNTQQHLKNIMGKSSISALNSYDVGFSAQPAFTKAKTA